MFNRILVPLDGSTLAERAIPHAVQIASIFGSSIILLQVLDPTSFHENPNPVNPLTWQIRKAEADIYMNRIADRIRENLGHHAPGLQDPELQDNDEKKGRVEYFIREGKTAENIVNFAHTENIDLLVISSHGSGGLSRCNISSVTQKVINLIYLSVLVVRAYNLPHKEGASIHYRRILLPIDSSRRAESALPAGIALARGGISIGLASEVSHVLQRPVVSMDGFMPTRLILATVVKPLELPFSEPYPVEIEQSSNLLMQASRQTVNNYLNEMRERSSVACETHLIENNNVALAIEELASEDEAIDLVVLCAHGHTGHSNWPYGHIARNYLEHGTKPVLVIQDVLRSQVRPTAAEIAAENSGGR